MSERTAVYRLFADDDELLYIGVAARFGNRWHQHADVQAWWPEVDHQTVTWFNSRDDALKAEAAAIHQEEPLYNIIHNDAVRKRAKDAATGFLVPDNPLDISVWETAESFQSADRARNKARDEHLGAVLEALRAGRPPTVVAGLSPLTAARIRQLARDAGIPPAKKGHHSPR